MTYSLPITWQMSGTIEVEADNLKDALSKLNNSSVVIQLLENAEMVLNTLDVDFDNILCNGNSVEFHTYAELKALFRKHEREHPSKHLNAVIVFKQESWQDETYPLASRSYLVSSNNKAFQPDMGGYSIYGSSLDGSDIGVRLDRYMKAESEVNGWIVDFCYLVEERAE